MFHFADKEKQVTRKQRLAVLLFVHSCANQRQFPFTHGARVIPITPSFYGPPSQIM